MSAVADRIPVSPTCLAEGLVAVLRADDAARYRPVVEVLVAEGVSCIELTLTTPGTLDVLAELAAAVPQAEVGVGTVLRPEDARRAADAGARFLVTPNAGTEVVRAGVERGLPVYAGAMTPSEAYSNWSAGAAAVKVFPAATVTADFVKHLHGPFPGMPVVPSGGVGIGDIGAWLRAGAVAVSLGGPLLGDALAGGDLDALRGRAAAARAAVARARA
ncbi:bifunctional 4-hydroxy-2-oxoglutarate aldolase/2-dehydro-3-deoxy-phosphogluconate aldolase, partial [Kineococcus glutinatus]|uniref:bifunctional 4-hydroxy-2-oxoglutarate aldolase/2-dehydro-3-deoxy-phosphogluconate aldolase n=1 Tax=Kineococcus glutinatus TaxID=1070872 RepID=UPI0031EE063A